jgi:predicted TIM-barrel fold metal-dependent hydrolase
MPADDRYVVISADCHGGGDLHEYRDYLDPKYRDEFDAWVSSYVIPYPDLLGPEGDRNWNSDKRLRELEQDGIVAEVIYPNTVPPFFPEASLKVQVPAAGAGDLERRAAGLRAHNRWLADFCARAPGRRAGIAQILLHDIDAAVDDIRWAKANGLTGGVLLPGTPPGCGVPPLYDADYYAPLWSVCEELQMPINHHSGSAVPPMGDSDLEHVIFILEVTWWAHRLLPHLIFAGVMERHPDLQFVFTEQGTAWIPEELFRLDFFADRFATAIGSQEHEWGFPVVSKLSLKPSEYWQRQCHVGSSFIRPAEVTLRKAVGVDKIMWGSDYPHKEASFPFSREAIRLSFVDVPQDEIEAMLGRNAAALYGFDYEALRSVAAICGPSISEIATPISPADIPREAEKCPAFVGMTGGK